MAYTEFNGQLTASGVRFAIIQSRFNSFLTEQLLKGAIDCIERHGGSKENLTVVRVPGAYEIPVIADKLAALHKFDAIVAVGAVIRGATPHADLINNQVSKALGEISLMRSLPIINSVICADNIEQAIERAGTKAGNKGYDGIVAAMEMASLCSQIDNLNADIPDSEDDVVTTHELKPGDPEYDEFLASIDSAKERN